jgi:probable H4MPT-linked C1 transfer pathway protein
MSWLGIDIGGANLKAADDCRWARTMPFALWRNPAGLARAIGEILHLAPPASNIAVTMTGELCDCFRTKAEGVRHILAAVEEVAEGRSIFVYLVDGRLVPLPAARDEPHLAAASNWHALASFACRYTEGRAGLLIDIGSTTTDIVPLLDGRPGTDSRTDTERLIRGELVYTGIGRTPICSVTRTLPWRGSKCPVAAELFATTADAYVVLGDLPQQSHTDWTADGRPLTGVFARERLARMVCADANSFSGNDARLAAEHIRDSQILQINGAIAEVCSAMPRFSETWVFSGSGEFMAGRLTRPLSCRLVSLAAEWGPAISAAAAAFALAHLAQESAISGRK